MPANKLPQELLSLIHHIHLNEAGWWDKAVQRLITTVLWIDKEPLALSQIFSELRKITGIVLDFDKVQQQVEQMCSDGNLICLADQKYKLSEKYLEFVSEEIKKAATLENEVKQLFIQQLREHCPSEANETTWTKFNESFLLPLIKSIGANSYHLVTGGTFELDTSAFDNFTSCFKDELHHSLKNVIISFLNPKNPSVRAYVLGYLNAYFFIEAGSLDESKIAKLTAQIEGQTNFNIFLDTNFMFSILGIHENPSNEAARSLKGLIDHLEGKISIKLFILPLTILEAKGVIGATYDEVKYLRLPSNLTEAASKMDLNGLALKFIQENMKRSINADDYFQPYLRDLIATSQGSDIEVHNDIDINLYRKRQDVVDAIMAQMEFEKRVADKRREAGLKLKKPKTYHQQEHDMILWHFIKDMRPSPLESPLKASYWAVSVDYRFLAFDAFKRRNMEIQVPICIHPTSLIQMLQFWVPRTPEFEETLLNSMKLPFLFDSFDPEAEKVTLRILEIIGRYEGAEDLPVKTVSEILVNSALRTRIKNEPELEKQVELVKEELIRIHAETTESLKKTAKEKDEQAKLIESLREELSSKAKEALETKERLSAVLRDFEEQQSDHRDLRNEVDGLEDKLTKKDIDDRKFRFVLKAVSVYLAGLIGCLIVSGLLSLAPLLDFMKIWPVITLLFTIGYIAYLDHKGKKTEIIKDSPEFIRFSQFKWLTFAILGIGWLFFSGILINNLAVEINLITRLKEYFLKVPK